MDSIDTVKIAIREAGGVMCLANHFKIARTSVYDWIRGAAVPVHRAVEIERKFGVSRRRLRPNDWTDIWPELKETEHA